MADIPFHKPDKLCLVTQDLGIEKKISHLSCLRVSKALDQLGINYLIGPINRRGIPFKKIKSSDLVFNLAYGLFGEDGVLSAVLDSLNVKYIGPSPSCALLTYDKRATKSLLTNAGIATPQSTTSFPLILKPATGGSSDSVRLVQNPDEMTPEEVNSSSFITEEYLPGREFCVTAVRFNKKIHIFPPVEIIKNRPVFSSAQKYSRHTAHLIPNPTLEKRLAKQITDICEHCFYLFQCTYYTKVDLVLDSSNRPVVIEIDGIPGFGSRSILPLAAESAGIPFPNLIRALIHESQQ